MEKAAEIKKKSDKLRDSLKDQLVGNKQLENQPSSASRRETEENTRQRMDGEGRNGRKRQMEMT